MELQGSLFSQSRGSSTAVEIKKFGPERWWGGWIVSAGREKDGIKCSFSASLDETGRAGADINLVSSSSQLAMSSSGEFDIFITSS